MCLSTTLVGALRIRKTLHAKGRLNVYDNASQAVSLFPSFLAPYFFCSVLLITRGARYVCMCICISIYIFYFWTKIEKTPPPRKTVKMCVASPAGGYKTQYINKWKFLCMLQVPGMREPLSCHPGASASPSASASASSSASVGRFYFSSTSRYCLQKHFAYKSLRPGRSA